MAHSVVSTRTALPWFLGLRLKVLSSLCERIEGLKALGFRV